MRILSLGATPSTNVNRVRLHGVLHQRVPRAHLRVRRRPGRAALSNHGRRLPEQGAGHGGGLPVGVHFGANWHAGRLPRLGLPHTALHAQAEAPKHLVVHRPVLAREVGLRGGARGWRVGGRLGAGG
eukprot:1187670-Prorocentrum_minimum.AAC.1